LQLASAYKNVPAATVKTTKWTAGATNNNVAQKTYLAPSDKRRDNMTCKLRVCFSIS